MRFKVIKLIFIFVFGLITLRLGYWQLVQSDDLSARADKQRLQEKEVAGKRGEILFADGSTLASTQPTFLVFLQPQVIKSHKGIPQAMLKSYQEDFAKKVAQVFLEEDQKKKLFEPDPPEATQEAYKDEFKKKKEEEKKQELESLEKFIYGKLTSNLYWVSLGRIVSHDVKKRLEELNLIGLGFDPTTSRFYPEGSSSAHLLGFVASDAYGSQTGYFGLEGYYNGELRGKKGVLVQEKDALGLPILIGRYLENAPVNGKKLTTHIDRSVQNIIEQKLQIGQQKYKAKSASAVVLDTKTGAVLAMASYPSYDPGNTFAYPKENFKNPITADGYEPGSTFKVLIMAAAVNEKVVDPEMVCDNCSGPLSIGGYTIKTWNNKYQDRLTMTDAIINSDNTGMVFAGKKLGLDKIYQYIQNFGFGELTGVDLQDETAPPLRDKNDWKEIDLATASFGQGISVSAIQVARAVGAIANRGKLMEPHVVSQVESQNETYPIIPKVISNPISEETAKIITEMMVQAVDKGEAQIYKKRLGLSSFKIAGKTGTAQIPVEGHYDANKTIASFVGFAPADDPKFVMLVRYDQPTTSIYGAETAAPTFLEIAKELFLYYGISPSD